MTIQESRYRLAKDPAELEAVEALLERFPDINEADKVRISKFFRTAESLDVGLLSSNKKAWDASERLRAEEPELFRMTGKGWAMIVGIAAVTLLVLFLLYAIAPQ